jgi:Rieske Fe-S protein
MEKKRIGRKDFIKASCSLIGLGLLAGLAESCSSYKVFKTKLTDGTISIPLSEFALEEVRIVRAPSVGYDILVRKMGPTSFTALLLKCTHQDWDLQVGKNQINCTYHGSVFDWMGNVNTGPAANRLRSVPIRIENELLLLKYS